MSVNIPGTTPINENGADNGVRSGVAASTPRNQAVGSTLDESRNDGRNADGRNATRVGSQQHQGAQAGDSAGHSAVHSLRSDLQNLKTDLDTLVTRANSMSERELSDAYARMMTKFSSMRFAAKGIAAEAKIQLNQGVDRTSDYVKAKPLQSVAIAAGVGLLMGMIATRR